MTADEEDLFSQLDFLNHVDTSDVVDLTQLSKVELYEIIHFAENRLILKLGEGLVPRSYEGKDLTHLREIAKGVMYAREQERKGR